MRSPAVVAFFHFFAPAVVTCTPVPHNVYTAASTPAGSLCLLKVRRELWLQEPC